MSNGLGLGAAIVSNNILENNARIKWIFRESPQNDLDNGWRFLSEIDSDSYLNDSINLSVCDWETLIGIVPAILPIYGMTVGTELILIYEGNRKYFIDSNSGDMIDLY